jgi:hypothetical protein
LLRYRTQTFNFSADSLYCSLYITLQSDVEIFFKSAIELICALNKIAVSETPISVKMGTSTRSESPAEQQVDKDSKASEPQDRSKIRGKDADRSSNRRDRSRSPDRSRKDRKSRSPRRRSRSRDRRNRRRSHSNNKENSATAKNGL